MDSMVTRRTSHVSRLDATVINNNNSNNNNNNNSNRVQMCNLKFFTVSSLHRKLSPARTLKWPRRNRVQRIERLSRATCHVTCQMVRRDSSAIKFDRV